jgi:hypothetical protein
MATFIRSDDLHGAEFVDANLRRRGLEDCQREAISDPGRQSGSGLGSVSPAVDNISSIRSEFISAAHRVCKRSRGCRRRRRYQQSRLASAG